jgi:ABC-type amino acid transport substrate-binding protein
MDEIGRRLGVAIEYRNFAFDGLGPALVQSQIDAAIGAISHTPEREAMVYFSNVYLVAEDGVLARADSDSTVENQRSNPCSADASGKRVLECVRLDR